MMMILPALTAATEATNSVPEIDFTALFFKMLALLAIIVALGFVLIRYFGTAGRLRGKGAGAHFELISWFRLDHKKTLFLVRIGKRMFAIGGTDANVNKIAEIDAEDLEK